MIITDLMGESTEYDQSVPASPAKLIELVLKGSLSSYDSLKSKYSFDNMAFTKLKSTYKQRTSNQLSKTGDKKVTARTQKQYDIILNFMEQGKEYGIQDFCNLLELKESRTNELLNGLLINENKIEIVGANRDRRYLLI